MADKWPAQYTIDQASTFMQDHLPDLLAEITALKEHIAILEAQVMRLEQTKADRKGRKPKTVGSNELVETDA